MCTPSPVHRSTRRRCSCLQPRRTPLWSPLRSRRPSFICTGGKPSNSPQLSPVAPTSRSHG
jgi:hypothetical protein